MRSADEWFEEYGRSHQNPTNKLIHWICVPIIVFSTVGLFWSIPPGPLGGLLPEPWTGYANWGSVLLVVGLLFYLRMSPSLFVGMLLFVVPIAWGNHALAQADFAPLWAVSAALFVVAWAGQFVGHEIEGAKPSFFKDIQFLLIGPAWLMHFLYRKAGLSY